MKIHRFLASLFIITVGISSCGYIIFKLLPQTSAGKPRNIIIAEKGKVESSLVVTGTLNPRRQIQVTTTSSGILKKLYVRPGDAVEAGQEVAQLDTTYLKANFDALVAKKNGLEARRQQGTVALSLAQAQEARQLELRQVNATSLDELERSRAAVQQAQADLAMAVAAIGEAGAQEIVTRAHLASATLTTPITGTVVDVMVMEGQAIGSESKQTTIMTIADLSEFEVELHFSEADILQVRPGLRAAVTTNGALPISLHTTIERIIPAPISVNGVKLYRAIGYVKSTDRTIYPGLTIQAAIVLASEDNIIPLPRSALRKDNGQSYVEVVQNETTIRRDVATGLSNRTFISIRSGIQAGDAIVRPEF